MIVTGIKSITLKKSVLLLLFTVCAAFAQEKKYQSLLWEISGNGLTKNSYLYGSMHVSDKVSYHLSDAFFKHLLEADMVANESEPSTWMELYGVLMPSYSYYDSNFYSGFYLKPLEKDDLYPLFHTNNFTLNNLLFRTNEFQKEYQEETYLDMFIYRTGKKYNKKTVGLEDTKTSLMSIMNADLTNARPSEENMAALQKILKNNAYEEALMNFYRDKDLDMIDSLTVLSTSENYLKALLYDRNIVMVKSIDSLARKGSLFAAVGAGHLPGKKGIIEMLRKKGYTVTPVFDSYTDKGKAKKQEIEEFFVKPSYTRRSTPDGMISLPLYSAVIENRENIESPDLANGGYINVKRALLLDYLKKDNKPFNPKSLDSLFYENIPGKILDKKVYTENGYQIYDIKNVTKTGNAQRYKYFITPLEIIVVSMAGEEDYVRKFEDEVFNNISLKPVTEAWASVAPKKGGFSVELPSYNIVYGDTPDTKTVSDTEIYGYDPKEQSNYFVLERTLTDNEELEDSEFELKRIHYEFYNQFDIDSTNTRFEKNPLGFVSSSKIGDKEIRLKTVLKGPKYYLLGSVGASESNTDRFFSSFDFKPWKFNEELRAFTDTTAHFTIQIPKNQNEKLDFENKRAIREKNEKVNEFSEKYKSYTFTLPSGQTIDLWYYKAHKYKDIESKDSIWSDFRKLVTDIDVTNNFGADEEFTVAMEDYTYIRTGYTRPGERDILETSWYTVLYGSAADENKVELTGERISNNDKEKYSQMDVMAISKNSRQAVKYKAVYRNGSSYIINTLVDKNYAENDPYIEKVFDSFSLLDESQTDTASDKMESFMEDARSEYDSIRYSALNSVNQLSVTEDDLPKLEQFINTFSFKNEEMKSLTALYEKIGGLKDPHVIPFLEKQYKQENTNTIIQFAILRALTNQNSKEGYKKIMELMDYDLPLTDNEYEIGLLFGYFEADLKNSEVLFPDIFRFYSIKEYHEPIVNFTALLLENGSIKPKKLKSYTDMIVTNAKLELKRVKSRKTKQEIRNGEEYHYRKRLQTDDIIGYINLLYPFRNDKEVKQFFGNVKKLDINEINLEMTRLDIANKDIDKSAISKMLKDPQTLFTTYTMLYEKEPALIKDINDEAIAQSAANILYELNPATDSLSFIEKKTAQINKNRINFYFYKVKTTDEINHEFGVTRIIAIAFVNSPDGHINPKAYRKLNAERIVDESDTPKTIKQMIDGIINEGHTRVSFGKAEEDYPMPYDDFEF